MSEAIKKFNTLSGKITLTEVKKIAQLAKDEGQTALYNRLQKGIETANGNPNVVFIPGPLAIEQVPYYDLPGLEPIPDYITPEDFTGLNKAVSPDDIYTMITNKLIGFIKEAKKGDYKKKWEGKKYGKGYLIPFNFVSKKRYRGVNHFLLTDYTEPLENPFFLTFKQVEKLKGKVKKGSKGHEVVYFTRLYTYSQKEPALSFGTYDKKKFEKWFEDHKHQIPKIKHNLDHAVPILKYYKVFNGKDVEGIDFDLDNFKTGYIENELPPNEPMPIADAIVANFPEPQVPIKHGGDKAAYYPGFDHIKMPHKADFETAQDYYRTLFHELGHSTGASNRLNRDLSGRFGSKKYAFEELIAELNAVFVSAEAGFMWHTNKNHAGYLKSWNSFLTQIEDDNRFVMRAASQAQKAADFILQPDSEGIPLYHKTIKKKTEKPAKNKTEPKTTTAPKKKGIHKFEKGQTVQLSKKWGKDPKGTTGKIKQLKKSVHGDPMYSLTIGRQVRMFPETVLQLPKKKLTKKELEAANPEGKKVKPKSVSVRTAISDVLMLDKFNFKEVSPLKASLIFNLFKNIDLSEGETAVDNASDYAIGVLKNDGPFHSYYDITQEIYLTELGAEFVNAVKNRLESLRNQKYNYALFEGLAGHNQLDPAWFPQWGQFKNKPKEAIKFLMEVKKGDALSALYRKEIGYIDIVWGENDPKTNKGFGLKHIIEKHGKEIEQLGFKVEDFIPIAVMFGDYKISKKYRNRIELIGNAFKIIITKDKIKNKTFVLTAFDLRPEKLKGLKGELVDINVEKLREHNKRNNGAGFTMPPLYGTTLICKNKATKTKPNHQKNGLKSPKTEITEPKTNAGGVSYSGESSRPPLSGKTLKASDVANMQFETLPLDQGWEHLFQTAPKNMRIAVWAKPKNGKTAACCKWAAYLTRFGPVLYNFADQGINLSTKNLILMSGLDQKPNAHISTTDNIKELAAEIESTGAHHVVIDMINQYIAHGVTPHIFKKEILQRFPDVGFTLVMEVTKTGNFKGDQSWTHLVDQLVTIDHYIMQTKGRYGTGEMISWHEGAKKYNPARYKEIIGNMEIEAAPIIEPEETEEYNFVVYS